MGSIPVGATKSAGNQEVVGAFFRYAGSPFRRTRRNVYLPNLHGAPNVRDLFIFFAKVNQPDCLAAFHRVSRRMFEYTLFQCFASRFPGMSRRTILAKKRSQRSTLFRWLTCSRMRLEVPSGPIGLQLIPYLNTSSSKRSIISYK